MTNPRLTGTHKPQLPLCTHHLFVMAYVQCANGTWEDGSQI